MTADLVLLIPIFFIIALIYSSAGFGGGSSYLAILALFPFDFIDIRIIALICNIMVTAASVQLFYINGFLKLKKVIPLVILSIPLAYLGGSYPLEENIFYIILGASLFIAGIIMLLHKSDKKILESLSFTNTLIGGGIGFLSGMVGIGGGIFLSPILHLSRWNSSKIIAASTAFFILVNSIAGLTGQIISNGFTPHPKIVATLIAPVLLGGIIGSNQTIHRFAPATIKRITGIVILAVAIRLLFKHLIA